MEELEMIIMNIVVDSGSARSYAMEAISMARQGAFAEADTALENAAKEMSKAHHAQTDLIQKEAGGQRVDVSLIMVHAQDHLMTGTAVIDLAKEFVELYKTFYERKD